MDDQFQDLQRLLRLKRHEVPPPEYFEDFLWEFHRRQRAELLRRPLWRLALDRLEGALPTFTPARYAYAGSCAAAVVAAALMSGHILTAAQAGSGAAPGGNSLAAVPRVGSVPAGPAPTSAKMARFDFHGPRPAVHLPELDFDRPRQAASAPRNARPRYVLDTQPVSYESSSSF